MTEFTITEKHSGKRLDEYIKMLFPNVTQTFIFKILRKGKLKINRKKVDHKYRLIKGDNIQIFVKEKDLTKRIEKKDRIKIVNKIEFEVAYEDEEILVVHKPPGLAVHGGDDQKEEITLLDQVLKYLDYDETKFKPYLAHRIDRNTSGLLIIGKTRKALEYFFQAFKNSEVKKTYIALVLGRMKEKEGVIDLPILRKDTGIQKVEINEEEGKSAITRYKVLTERKVDIGSQGINVSLLELTIGTGRTHQIRIHLQAIGHPVLGDRQYGDWSLNKIFKDEFGLKRQFLHAYSLHFQHPNKNKDLQLKANLSHDLSDLLKNLKISF